MIIIGEIVGSEWGVDNNSCRLRFTDVEHTNRVIECELYGIVEEMWSDLVRNEFGDLFCMINIDTNNNIVDYMSLTK